MDEQPGADHRPGAAVRRLPDLSAMGPVTSPLLDRLRPAAVWLVHRVWRATVHHADRVPAGPAIFAVNHVGILDGPLAVALVPGSQAMAKRELWGVRFPLLPWLLTRLGQIPIDRRNPDPECLRTCLKLLDQGRRLVIFPESHRGKGDFAQFKGGAAYLAMASGTPVVPVALLGTAVGGTGIGSIPRPGGRVDLVYGEPIVVERVEWPRTQVQVAELSHRLRDACVRTIQQAQQELGLELL